MATSPSIALLFLALTAACSTPAPVTPPANAGDEPAEEREDFDPAEEAPQQPFEMVNGLRGPGLSINGLRLRGERGSLRLMVTAYEDGRSIAFRFMPRQEIPPDWLAACPRSDEDPEQPRIEVKLEGAGELSDNVWQQDEDSWSTSIGIAWYARLDTLQFEICGASYVLEDAYRERLKQHARLASQRAAEAYREERQALKARCDQGHDEACLELGAMLLHAEGGPADPAGALALFLPQCERGVDAACLDASTATLVHVRIDQDKATRYREAVALALRACELGGKRVGMSCWRAAALSAAGFAIPADPKSAQRSVDVACKRGFQPACSQRDDLLSCARGTAESCVRLADAEADSLKFRDNGEEAIWRMAACRRGHAPSCQR